MRATNRDSMRDTLRDTEGYQGVKRFQGFKEMVRVPLRV